jgi:hypothetical protein
MNVRRTPLSVLIALAVAGSVPAIQAAPALKNAFCLDCHADKNLSMTNAAGREISLFVDKAQLAASAHGTNTCISCHSDATVKHPDDHKVLQPVNCTVCHEKPAKLEGVTAHAVKKKE